MEKLVGFVILAIVVAAGINSCENRLSERNRPADKVPAAATAAGPPAPIAATPPAEPEQPKFALYSGPFWGLVAICMLLLIAALVVGNDWPTAAAVVLFLLLTQGFSDLQPLSYVFASWANFGRVLATIFLWYLVGGIVCLINWTVLNLQHRRAYDLCRARWLRDRRVGGEDMLAGTIPERLKQSWIIYVGEHPEIQIPDRHKHYAELVQWANLWPLVILKMVLLDCLGWGWTAVLHSMSGVIQAISDWLWAGTRDDLQISSDPKA